MTLLPALLAAHLIGDWVVQTDEEAANKMTSWAAMAQHMLGYHVCIVAACIAAGLGWPAAEVVFWCSLLTHAFIDRRWPVRWLMTHTGSAAFADTSWGVMAVDQALHLSILCVLAAVFA